MSPAECEILLVNNVDGGPPSYPNASSALYSGYYYLTKSFQTHPTYDHERLYAKLVFSKGNIGGQDYDRWEFTG